MRMFPVGIVVAATALLVTLDADRSSYAQQGLTTTPGDPTQVVRQALMPLFQLKKGADANETLYLSSKLKGMVDAYFATDDNGAYFDADLLLGMQEWDQLLPLFSSFVIDETHVKVQVSF